MRIHWIVSRRPRLPGRWVLGDLPAPGQGGRTSGLWNDLERDMPLHSTGAYFLQKRRTRVIHPSHHRATTHCPLHTSHKVNPACPRHRSHLARGPHCPQPCVGPSLTPLPLRSPSPSATKAYDNLGKQDMSTQSHGESVGAVRV